MQWSWRSARFAVLQAAIGVAAWTSTSRAQPGGDVASHPWIGEPAPAFELQTTAGDTLRLADYEGDFLVIHFGTSW